MRIAGADGCPGGWAVVTASLVNGGILDLQGHRVVDLTTSIGQIRSGELAALAIDMPIGLLDVHPRTADVEARRLLGARRSSVFPTPLRTTLPATGYADACERSRAMCGKALSKQAWNLMPKIRELDSTITAGDQPRVAEAHPECSFLRMHDDEPLTHPKSTSEGRALRAELLANSGWFDTHTRKRPSELTALIGSGVAPVIDMLDALALVVTAQHIAVGTERRLGDQVDHLGRRAEIVF